MMAIVFSGAMKKTGRQKRYHTTPTGQAARAPGNALVSTHRAIRRETVQSFVERLSKQAGKNYRLPSEDESEYAARAGTSKEFYDNADPASLDT